MAWEQRSDEKKFVELDLTKLKPAIQKVVVYGWHIEDAVLKIGNGGELTVPAIKEEKTEEFSKTFILEEAVCPDVLRLEMTANRVELYEIEAF